MSYIFYTCNFHVYITARLTEEKSLFTYGGNLNRKKRQDSGSNFECTSFDNCGDHSIVGVDIESLNFTDEQRAFCKNNLPCLYDLEVTGDEVLANITRMASENAARMQLSISE